MDQPIPTIIEPPMEAEQQHGEYEQIELPEDAGQQPGEYEQIEPSEEAEQQHGEYEQIELPEDAGQQPGEYEQIEPPEEAEQQPLDYSQPPSTEQERRYQKINDIIAREWAMARARIKCGKAEYSGPYPTNAGFEKEVKEMRAYLPGDLHHSDVKENYRKTRKDLENGLTWEREHLVEARSDLERLLKPTMSEGAKEFDEESRATEASLLSMIEAFAGAVDTLDKALPTKSTDTQEEAGENSSLKRRADTLTDEWVAANPPPSATPSLDSHTSSKRSKRTESRISSKVSDEFRELASSGKA